MQLGDAASLTRAQANLLNAPGSDTWLQTIASVFGFAFVSITTSDPDLGLPTLAPILWPDDTDGNFTGTTDDENGYTGFVVTWEGESETRTVTVSGITYDPTTGVQLGPTDIVVT